MKTIWQCLIFSEDNLPVLHFSLFFSIFCEDNCTTATYFVKTIVLVLMKTIVHWSEDNCQLLIYREDNFTSEDNCTTVRFTYVTKTIANSTTYSRKPGDYNGTIIFEFDIMKNSSPLNLKLTFFATVKTKITLLFCWTHSTLSSASKCDRVNQNKRNNQKICEKVKYDQDLN